MIQLYSLFSHAIALSLHENSASARLLLLLLLLCVLLLAYLFYLQNRRNQQLHHTEQLRSGFLSKVSHEIRNPLTIIMGLSRELQEQKEHTNHNALTYLSAIERQGKNLSSLVNQLQDVAVLDSAEMPTDWKRGNLVPFMEMLSETMTVYSAEKEIEFIFFCEEREIEADYAPVHLHKIVHYLVTNAVRYSSSGSKIFMTLEKKQSEKNRIIIKVIDHGIGISKSDLPHIFDFFYKSPTMEEPSGGGLELSLTRHLVEMLNGTIHVDSEEGKGSTFTVELPLHRKRRKHNSLWQPVYTPSSRPAETMTKENQKRESIDRTNGMEPRTILLLVSENRDTNLYISSLFNQNSYALWHARCGEGALNMIHQHLPDMVLVDITSSTEHCFSLCKEIRCSPLINHIPVIILSASSSDAEQIEGIKCGADLYIHKPFNGELLQLRVEKLLESRNLLKEKYCRTQINEEEHEKNNSAHIDFLRQVTDIIHREMRNPAFSSKMLADELAISVSQLNKKLNSAAGVPSSTYILQVKLSQAKKILTTERKTIGEVAADCGIFDVNYFSRVFKKNTGITPTQYQRLPLH